MRRKLSFLFIIIGIISFSCNEIDRKTDLDKYKIKGKVKYIEEKTFDIPETNEEETNNNMPDEYTLVKFSSNGYLISQIDCDGFTYGKILLKRGRNEILQEELSYENGNIYRTKMYKNNYNGMPTQLTIYNSDRIINSKITYKYDKNDSIIEELRYNPEGSIYGKSSYIYDDKKNNIEYIEYDDKGNMSFRDIYIYDSKRNKVETITYISEGNLETKQIYKYDNKGNRIELIRYDYDSIGNLSHKETYKYDDKGNETEYTSKYFHSDNSEFKLNNIYVYDSKGNWIKKTEYSDNKIVSITERKIVYYGDKDENNYREWDSPSFKGIAVKPKNRISM